MSRAEALGKTTLADVVLPAGSKAADAAVILVMSWAIALCAQIYVVLPQTPVPLTGSTLGVLYAGALLGSRRGAAAVGLYLLQGALGLPFFAGAAAGLIHFFGPSGGYLLGFLPGAFLAGLLAEQGWDRGPWKAMALMLAGDAVIFACGLAWLARFAPIEELLAKGLSPFVAADMAKAALCAALLPLGWRLAGRAK